MMVQKLAIISTTVTEGQLSEPRRQGVGRVQALRAKEAGRGVGSGSQTRGQGIEWIQALRAKEAGCGVGSGSQARRQGVG